MTEKNTIQVSITGGMTTEEMSTIRSSENVGIPNVNVIRE